MTGISIPAAIEHIAGDNHKARMIVEACVSVCGPALAPRFLAKLIDNRWTGATLEAVFAQCFKEAGVAAHRRLINNLFEPKV